jgi:poly-gamma-glutamate synthesis protein (capsule biosynthesis protein)
MKKAIAYILIFLAIAITVLVITLKVASAPISLNLFETAPKNKVIQPEIKIPEIPATTTLLFGGDVMLSRVVNQQSVKYDDWTWPFLKIADTMSSADLTIINLESPFTIGGNHLVKTGSFSFNADPASLAGLQLAGIDIVSLANNHTINQGKTGIADTQKLLTENDIAFTGAGLTEAEARTPVIKETNGVKIGFLAYAYPNDYSLATANTHGLAGMNIAKMTADVKNLKTQTDLVVVMMHAGIEYVNKPNEQQKKFARASIDAGANLVIGHHPHWVQVTENYQGKPIIYSLGNLIFDQMWSKETQEGALAQIEIVNKKITGIKIIPISIKDYGQGELATGQIKQDILKRMGLANDLIKL